MRPLTGLLALLSAATSSAQALSQLCNTSSQLISDRTTPNVPWSDLVQSSAFTLSTGDNVVPGRVYSISFVATNDASTFALVSDSGEPSAQSMYAACANPMAHGSTTLFTWTAPSTSATGLFRLVAGVHSPNGSVRVAIIDLHLARPPSAPPAAPPPWPPSPPLPFLSGFASSDAYATADIGQYPGTGYVRSVRGSFVLQARTDGSLHVYAVLTGLPANAVGGWHVHEGLSCDNSIAVGNHYYDAAAGGDPWTTVTYTSDAHGVARISTSISGFSLSGANGVIGRAIVIHDAHSSTYRPRIGCGLIMPNKAQVALIGAYPRYSGYAGDSTIDGLLLVREVADGIHVSGTLAGLTPTVTSGWHVHAGYSCDEHAGVKGHYYTPGEHDPWNDVTYTSDTYGVATVDLTGDRCRHFPRALARAHALTHVLMHAHATCTRHMHPHAHAPQNHATSACHVYMVPSHVRGHAPMHPCTHCSGAPMTAPYSCKLHALPSRPAPRLWPCHCRP